MGKRRPHDRGHAPRGLQGLEVGDERLQNDCPVLSMTINCFSGSFPEVHGSIPLVNLFRCNGFLSRHCFTTCRMAVDLSSIGCNTHCSNNFNKKSLHGLHGCLRKHLPSLATWPPEGHARCHQQLRCCHFLYYARGGRGTSSTDPFCCALWCSGHGRLETLAHAFLDCPDVAPVARWLCDTWRELAGVEPPCTVEVCFTVV